MYILNSSRLMRPRAAEQVADGGMTVSTSAPQPTAEAPVSDDRILFLIEPRQLLRECFAACIEAQSDFRVRAFASVGEWVMAGASQRAAIIMLSMGGQGRREVLADFDTLARAGSKLPVVLLAQHESIDCVLEMLAKGVRAYIPATLSVGIAIEALRLVKAGGTFVPASSLLAAQTPAGSGPLAFQVGDTVFTDRQAAVIKALCKGKANKIIACELSMQESTVKVHVRNIMRKLKAKNRTEVAVIVNASNRDSAA